MINHNRTKALLISRCALVAFALLTTACTHTIEVGPHRLPELAEYSTRGSVVVDDGDGEIEITDAHEPSVIVYRDHRCSFGEFLRHRCDAVIDVALEQISSRPDAVSFHIPASLFASGFRTVDVPPQEVERVLLRLRNFKPHDWQPRWGVGMTFAGPAVISNLTLQAFPLNSLVIEAGVAPITSMIGLHAGLRLRPIDLGRVRPFIGTWINFLAAFDGESGDGESWSSTGLRVGLDLQLLSSWRWLLTPEINLARPLGENGEIFDGISGAWIPWGGISTSVLF